MIVHVHERNISAGTVSADVPDISAVSPFQKRAVHQYQNIKDDFEPGQPPARSKTMYVNTETILKALQLAALL